MLTHTQSVPAAPARVVVLGAKGFVAGNLIRHLEAAKIPVHAVSASDVDLTQPASVEQLTGLLRADDAVVFVSALTPDRGKDIATLMRNLQMGQHVCAALAARPCAHVVYISTDAVYDDNANPVRETSPAAPSGYHGAMHVVRERMLIETLKASKTPLALLRPSLLFGPGDTHNGYGPNRFVRTALTDATIALFGGGEEKRDHVFIDDVSALTLLVLQHRSSGVLNIATGEAHSFREVADQVKAIVGDRVEIKPSPRANPITHRHFDMSEAIALFPGFRFTPLRAGLERMVREASAAR
jgi:UDP-glucose 4-epimerase